MALINCPECSTEVSDTVLKCPRCALQLRIPKRGFFGKLFKLIFIGFNILMGIWLFSYWGSLGEMTSSIGSEAEKVGTAIGGTIGTGFIVVMWVFGDIILGLFVHFTRPKGEIF
jgi:hypothetical protein